MISGLFHKRHVSKSVGAVTANCTYTCHQCQQDKGNEKAKLVSKGAKSQPQDYKKALAKCRLVKLRGKRAAISKKWVRSIKGKVDAAESPLRRSARQAAKYVAVLAETHKGHKKGKQKKSKKEVYKRTKSKASNQKKRTRAFYSYWLNGLHLSRWADDDRVTEFREKSIFSPDHSTSARRARVKCSLCGEGSRTSKSSYIGCETCGGKHLSLQNCSDAFSVS